MMPNPAEPETLEILSLAFASESRAEVRQRAFAAQAEKEGRAGPAALFAAAALSHQTRARRLLNLMRGKIGDTEHNLAETLERQAEALYPGLISSANGASKVVTTVLEQSRDIEQTVAALFTAKRQIPGERPVYHVCRICGHVAVGLAPERCPVCKAVKEKFKTVG